MKKLVIAALVAVSLSGCGSEVNCPESLPVLEAAQVAGVVPMPAPPPAPRPPAPAPRPPAPRAPAPAPKAPAPPKPAAPKPAAPRPMPKYVPPPKPYRPPAFIAPRYNPGMGQRPVYVNNGIDPVPYLWLMMATNGSLHYQQAPVECQR